MRRRTDVHLELLRRGLDRAGVLLARFGDHAALLLFLADGIVQTSGKVFSKGWCHDGSSSSLWLHEDANHKLKNFVQFLRRSGSKTGSFRGEMSKAVKSLLTRLPEGEQERRHALALADTILNEAIDAQSTVLAESLMSNRDVHAELAVQGTPGASYVVALARVHEAFVAPGLSVSSRRARLLRFRDEAVAYVGAARLSPATWRKAKVAGLPKQLFKATWFNVSTGLHALDVGVRLTALSTDAVEKVFGM